MNSATKKWLFLKISSVALIPLMAWFIINLVSVFDKDYIDVVAFFSNQPSKILFSLLLVFAYFFSALSISEIRHLIMDLGYGFELNATKITGLIVIIGSFILTVLIYLLGKQFI